MLGIPVARRRALVDLGLSLQQWLAHLEGDEPGKSRLALAKDPGQVAQQFDAIAHAASAPDSLCVHYCGQSSVHLVGGLHLEACSLLSRGGVDGHDHEMPSGVWSNARRRRTYGMTPPWR